MSPLVGLVIHRRALKNLAGIPAKIGAQLIKKAKGLILEPFPDGAIQLRGIVSDCDEPIYRIRSGDYRILYVVRKNPSEVIVLDIDNRKDVYR